MVFLAMVLEGKRGGIYDQYLLPQLGLRGPGTGPVLGQDDRNICTCVNQTLKLLPVNPKG